MPKVSPWTHASPLRTEECFLVPSRTTLLHVHRVSKHFTIPQKQHWKTESSERKISKFFFPQMPKIQIEKCKEQEQQRKYDSSKVTRDFNMRMQWWRDLWNVENKFKRMSKRLLRKKSWDKKIHIQYGRKSAYWKEIKIKYYEWKVQSVKQKITVKIHDNRFFWGKRKNIPTRRQNFG